MLIAGAPARDAPAAAAVPGTKTPQEFQLHFAFPVEVRFLTQVIF